MNQDEITKDIKHANGMIENLGLQIVWWKCRSLGLQEKQDQLAEVEKPEWQQGDYGLAIQKRGTDSGVYSFIFVGDRVYYNSGTYDEKTVLSDGSFYEYVRLGNVFDDIKALAKPLKGFIEGGVRYSINTKRGALDAQRILLVMNSHEDLLDLVKRYAAVLKEGHSKCANAKCVACIELEQANAVIASAKPEQESTL